MAQWKSEIGGNCHMWDELVMAKISLMNYDISFQKTVMSKFIPTYKQHELINKWHKLILEIVLLSTFFLFSVGVEVECHIVQHESSVWNPTCLVSYENYENKWLALWELPASTARRTSIEQKQSSPRSHFPPSLFHQFVFHSLDGLDED